MEGEQFFAILITQMPGVFSPNALFGSEHLRAYRLGCAGLEKRSNPNAYQPFLCFSLEISRSR